jgi:hypothetical protein
LAVQIEPSKRRGWEDEGERIALDLDEIAAALIIGGDPRAAARVAVAIARVQARRRRVVVVDAIGELAPIERLVPDDVTHGLVDMLDHGVSLGRVSVPVDRAGNLFVIPSGAPPFDTDGLFASGRWPHLAGSFRNAGALLLVVAPASSPTLARIVPNFDGVVLVGDADAPSGARLLARATPLRADEKSAARVPALRANTPRAPYWVAIAATVLAVAALGWWAVRSSFGPESAVTSSIISAGAVVDGMAPVGAPSPSEPAGDSMINVAASAAAPAQERQPAPVDETPVDPEAAVHFGVALAQYNDVTAALTRIAEEVARGTPASTYAPAYDTNLRRQVYLVIAGAFHDSTDATALLRSLRRQRVLGQRQGHVIDAPFAILVRSGLPADQAKPLLDAYRSNGLPVYSLVQPSGGINIYAGAFRSAAAAELLLRAFDHDGEQPRIVNRAGRSSQ